VYCPTTPAAGTAESTAAAFPVTTAFELPGMVVERNLGIAFGLVVRAMGFSKTVAGGISSLRQGEVSQFTVVLEDARRHAVAPTACRGGRTATRLGPHLRAVP